MGIIEWVVSIALLVLAVALIVLVLFQSGKDKHLSGAIAGGAETFFGKTKGSNMNKTLSITTVVVSVVFVVLVVAMYLMF